MRLSFSTCGMVDIESAEELLIDLLLSVASFFKIDINIFTLQATARMIFFLFFFVVLLGAWYLFDFVLIQYYNTD
jgi:hypothetical protein